MTDVNALLAQLAKLVNAKPTKSAKGGKGRKAAKPDLDNQTVVAFAKAGFTNVKPRETVRTYGKWTEVGRQVIPGQKGTKVGPFTLFHLDQTAPLGDSRLVVQPKAEAAAPASKKPMVVIGDREITDADIEAFLARKAKAAAESKALDNEYGPSA